MARRGQISIDRIVAIRSSVLPFYIIIQSDGNVKAADEVSEDGNDFLTTRMYGDQISFQSIHGDYLSAEADQISTRRYCSSDERFTVEKRDSQYAFRARNGKYLSVAEREPFVTLADTAGEQEVFQLFSLMMNDINVGKQMEQLEKSGMVMIESLLAEEQLSALRCTVLENGGDSVGNVANGHECRISNLTCMSPAMASLATHPVVMQLVRRSLSPELKLSDIASCRTDADYVRKELEVTTWHVVDPYGSVEFPGLVDPRVSLTCTWFIDELDSTNSTWAFAEAPRNQGLFSPALPHLSSPDEVRAVVSSAKQLNAKAGSLWAYLGPVWLSNNVGAASFWKDYDAQTRYKHLSGQKVQGGSTFKALTDAQRSAPPREENCPMLLQATYVREYVKTAAPPTSASTLANLQVSDSERQLLELMLPLAP